MMNNLEPVIKQCRVMITSQNAGPNDVITYLHSEGINMIDSMKALRELYGLSLGEAKSLVTAHPAWDDEVSNADVLHKELLTALEKGEVRDTNDE